jgi:hypothetical protein
LLGSPDDAAYQQQGSRWGVLQTPLRCPARAGQDLGMLQAVARRVAGGETVQIRPRGSSMVPIINSRQLVTIRPVDAAKVEVGDVVLARVAGTVYLHLVSAVDRPRRRVQISNNRGRVNGWTSQDRVYGICTEVDGVPRPRARGKVRSAAAS